MRAKGKLKRKMPNGRVCAMGKHEGIFVIFDRDFFRLFCIKQVILPRETFDE